MSKYKRCDKSARTNVLFDSLALDLVEVYFQIVHTRFPLLNPSQIRARLGVPSRGTPNNSPFQAGYPVGFQNVTKPIHPAMVATILAWGAKFAENTLFVADRQRNGGTLSLFAKTLINRARELAEALKVHRVACAEHVVISLLIECLQSRKFRRCKPMLKLTFQFVLETPDDPSGTENVLHCIY